MGYKMTILSTGPFSVSRFAGVKKFTPYVLYGEIIQSDTIPFGGNTRWEKIRSLEKVANIVEIELRRHGLDVAYPVKFTNHFGNEPARLTINGNWSSLDITGGTEPPAKIADDVIRLNANVVYEGQGSFNSADLMPSSDLDQLVIEIKSWFEDKIGSYIDIMSLEIHGVLYGRRGRHFPNP
jgi:hypothetical protein